MIARVSDFLILLDQVSAGSGEDDDSALISRKDIGLVWWGAVLKRTMLGTAKQGPGLAVTEAGRKPVGGRKDQPGKPAEGRPLTVSSLALVAATRMIIWAMSPSLDLPDHLAENVTPFGVVVIKEFEERTIARLQGIDESYGVKNLEECIIGWGEKCPKVSAT